MAGIPIPEDDEPPPIDKSMPVMRVDLDVPDGVKLLLVINGVEMDLDD